MSQLALLNICKTKFSEYISALKFKEYEMQTNYLYQVIVSQTNINQFFKIINFIQINIFLCITFANLIFTWLIILFSIQISSLMPKNQSALMSTGGEIFRQNKLKDKSYSYANIPMKKDTAQWNNSAAVLRNSNSLYSIPKDSRFKRPIINYYNHLQLQYPSSLSNRATTFGYGKKVDIPEVFRNNANIQGINAPFYEIDDMKTRRTKSSSIKKGKTIGVNWDSYATSRAPHRPTVHCPEQTRQNPGMKYEISSKTGGEAQVNTIHSRLMMFTQLKGHQTLNEPGPQNYLINEKLVSKSSQQTNIGVGKKSDFTSNPQFAAVPGPIYNIKGFCDKFQTLKIKNLGKSWK